MKSQLVSHLGCVHGIRQILFVGKTEQNGIPKLVLVEHAHQLVARFVNSLPIVTVDNENETLGVLEVVSPQRSDFVLAAHVPHRETEETLRLVIVCEVKIILFKQCVNLFVCNSSRVNKVVYIVLLGTQGPAQSHCSPDKTFLLVLGLGSLGHYL